MGPEQWLFLQWHEHKGSLVSTFEKLFERNTFVDCTLAAEGQYLNVHKVILSACSPYFEILLNENRDKHPIIILKDVKFRSLKSIIEYMYRGEANVLSTEIKDFLAAAESLQIKGLGKQGGGDSKGQPTKDLRDLIDAQPLPPSNAMRVIGEEKDKWGDSDLSSTITDTAQESVVTQKNTLLFSQGDVGTKVPISQKVPKPVAINENLNTEQSWLKTEKADEALKVLNKVLPPHSTLNIGSHTIEPVHPASKDMLPNANVCAASTQSIPSTSDVQMAMEVTPKAEPEDLPAPAAAVDIEDAETASLASSVIELSDTTEEWAEEDMEEAPTPSQATGNSFAGGSEEARARSEAAPGDAAREVAAGDAAAEQQELAIAPADQQMLEQVLTVMRSIELRFLVPAKARPKSPKAARALKAAMATACHHQRLRRAHARHTCPLCDASFPWLCLLKRHMRTHMTKRMYACKDCDYTTANKKDFANHLLIHTWNKPHFDEIDDENGFRNKLVIERKQRQPSLVRSMLPQYKNAVKSNSVQNATYRCKQCKEVFVTKRELIRHINCAHGFPAQVHKNAPQEQEINTESKRETKINVDAKKEKKNNVEPKKDLKNNIEWKKEATKLTHHAK